MKNQRFVLGIVGTFNLLFLIGTEFLKMSRSWEQEQQELKFETDELN